MLSFSLILDLRYFCQALFHSLSILLLNPKCIRLLFLLLRVDTLAEYIGRKIFVRFSCPPQRFWSHYICNTIAHIILEIFFCWVPIPVWIVSVCFWRSLVDCFVQ